MSNSEIKRFQAYLLYKNRNKILTLFNVFVKYPNEEELSNQLKRRGLENNHRRNKGDLFNLLRHFWSDNIENEKPEVEINSLMSFANSIYEKGLISEAIQLIEKAEGIAKVNNLHHLFYHCNRIRTTMNLRYFPDRTEQLMQEYEIKQGYSINQIKTTSRVTYLNQRIYYLFYKGLWALSEEQLQFLEDAGDKITAILLSKDIEVNHQIAMFGLACTYARLIQMDGAKAAAYGRKALETLKACPESFPHRTINFATCYTVQLITLLNSGQRKEYDTTFLEFTEFVEQLTNPGVSTQYQHLAMQVSNLRYTHIFDEQMDVTLKITANFLEKEGEHLPPVFIGPLCMYIFELYFCCGRSAEAEDYLEKIKGINDKTNLPEIKFMEVLCEVFLNYEKDNFDFIINLCLSFRRRYSKYLRYNLGGSLLISYSIKLCKAIDNESKSVLYKKLKTELIAALSNVRNRSLLIFWNILPWIDSKLNNKETIVQWLQSETYEATKTP